MASGSTMVRSTRKVPAPHMRALSSSWRSIDKRLE
jgi:hypothetical protein